MIDTGFITMYSKYIVPMLFSLDEIDVDLHPSKFKLRPRSSDVHVLAEVYGDLTYEPTITDLTDVTSVVDLGANVGIFSVWAAHRYSPSQIVAVEMESGNLESLRTNIKLNNIDDVVTLVDKAIYSERTQIPMKKNPLWNAKHELEPSQDDSAENLVNTITLRAILDDYQLKVIDFLKIDIEGSEQYLVTEKNEPIFRNNVRYIVMEIHHNHHIAGKTIEDYFENLGYQTHIQNTLLDRTSILEAYNTRLV